MKRGTRSVLFGVHAFWLHPVFVARAWISLYGWPWDPRLWCAFFLHDLGYWGCSAMDSEEGERHVVLGAHLMNRLFDAHGAFPSLFSVTVGKLCDFVWGHNPQGGSNWYSFMFYHSRFMAKRYGAPVSRLCFADKLSFGRTPKWVYLPMAAASGELKEYMGLAKRRTEAGEPKVGPDGKPLKYASANLDYETPSEWYDGVKRYIEAWVAEHKHGAEDTWTPHPDTVSQVEEAR